MNTSGTHAILDGLRTQHLHFDLREHEEVSSTNALLKTLADDGAPEGLIILAHHQTGGRGRLGRTWADEPGANLLFSILLRPAIPHEQFPMLTYFAAVAVADAVQSQTGIVVDCKWPNDLLLGGKKLCGILLEGTQDKNRSPYAIIGIGLNVRQRTFPAELQETATSLAHHSPRTLDRAEMLRAILFQMDILYRNVLLGEFSSIISAWERRAILFGKPVTVVQGSERRTGIARALAPDGGLIVDFDGIAATVYAGDVTLAH
jgi:BirA family biotin operon repressor/biotin-[acetyl-CoA-carboxylase] ligase